MQHHVDEDRLKPVNLRVGGLDRKLGLLLLGIRDAQGRLGAFELVRR